MIRKIVPAGIPTSFLGCSLLFHVLIISKMTKYVSLLWEGLTQQGFSGVQSCLALSLWSTLAARQVTHLLGSFFGPKSTQVFPV